MTDVLLARSEWIGPFLDAVKAQKVSAAMIGSTRRTSLMKNPDQSIRDRATTLFGDTVSAPRNDVINKYRAALSLPGHRDRWAAGFRTHLRGLPPFW